MEVIDVIQTALLALLLVAVAATPVVLYRRLLRTVRTEVSRLISRMDQNLSAGVKLLEVRDYYQQTSAELKKMLDEAYREGNRFRQDQIRKLQDRLDALKVRALDKTVSILDAGEAQGPRKKRRRRPRRRKPKTTGPNGSAAARSDSIRPKSNTQSERT